MTTFESTCSRPRANRVAPPSLAALAAALAASLATATAAVPAPAAAAATPAPAATAPAPAATAPAPAATAAAPAPVPAAVPAVAAPADSAGESASLMKELSGRDLHDLADESWNAYAQLTTISSWKPAFPAAYTNLNGSPNSLLPEAEHSFTTTATLFVGVRLWPGGEAYFVPELIAERAFSQLRGLGGAIQNFELQKTGSEALQIYRSRGYLRQTFGLGGGSVQRDSDQMQLGGPVEGRRLVLVAGNFSILDFFDKNSFTSDTRQQFLGLAFMTHAAWDFASDARGYSWGGLVELYYDDWALRFGRISPPRNPNQLPVGLRLDRYYGDQLELEHQHLLFGRQGVVRVLAFRNRELMGRFDDALAALDSDPGKNAAACTTFNYGSQNATAPDLCWVRKSTVKVGLGVNLEQQVTRDGGIFLRAMVSDGQSEVQAYTSTDRSVSLGALTRGSLWGRPRDRAGAAAAAGWISAPHAAYLARGGIDGFIGDGGLRQAAEGSVELFYSLNLLQAFWLTLDYQRIWNPAFNADRGPVNVFGLRFHAQY